MCKAIFYINNEYHIEKSTKNAEVLNLIYNGAESNFTDFKLNSYDKGTYNDILDEYEFIKGITEPSRPHRPKLRIVKDAEMQAIEQKKFEKSMKFYEDAMQLFNERTAQYRQNRQDIKDIFAELGYVF